MAHSSSNSVQKWHLMVHFVRRHAWMLHCLCWSKWSNCKYALSVVILDEKWRFFFSGRNSGTPFHPPGDKWCHCFFSRENLHFSAWNCTRWFTTSALFWTKQAHNIWLCPNMMLKNIVGLALYQTVWHLLFILDEAGNINCTKTNVECYLCAKPVHQKSSGLASRATYTLIL